MNELANPLFSPKPAPDGWFCSWGWSSDKKACFHLMGVSKFISHDGHCPASPLKNIVALGGAGQACIFTLIANDRVYSHPNPVI